MSCVPPCAMRWEARAHLKHFRRVGPLLRVDLERLREVVPEYWRERLRVRDLGRAVCGDEVERLEGVLVEIWGLALDHL